MKYVSREDINELLQSNQTVGVSIYMPAHHGAGRQGQQQDQIRFKNLIKSADSQLLAAGCTPRRITRLLDPAHRLVKNGFFKEQHANGMAFFLSDGVLKRYYFSGALEETVVVGRQFYIQPLLHYFSAGRRFFVLCLSQKKMRFFEGSSSALREIQLKNTPTSIREALKYEVYPRSAMFLGTAQGRARGNLMVMEGHGIGIFDKKDELFRYFRMVDRGLHAVLAQENAPLILAGVEYLLPLFRDASTYQYIADEAVRGNPDHLRDHDLHRAALAIAEPFLRKQETDAVRRYFRLSGYLGRLTSDDQREIITAAARGRVETLFIKSGARLWGKFVQSTGAVQFSPQESPDSEDLADRSVVSTLLHSGYAYIIEQGSRIMPDARPMAAIFRY